MFMPIAALIAKTFLFSLPPVALDLSSMMDMSLASSSDELVETAFVFDWAANAVGTGDARQGGDMQAALDQAKQINQGASWICSPSGSGKKSRCYPG